MFLKENACLCILPSATFQQFHLLCNLDSLCYSDFSKRNNQFQIFYDMWKFHHSSISSEDNNLDGDVYKRDH